MRWLVFFCFAFALLAPSSPSPFVPEQVQNGKFVSPNGMDVGKCGANYPCLTITYALSMAMEGATVWISPGKYFERVVVNTSGIKLVGASGLPNDVQIVNVGTPAGDGINILSGANNVDVANLSVCNFQTGIAVHGAAPTLRNLMINNVRRDDCPGNTCKPVSVGITCSVHDVVGDKILIYNLQQGIICAGHFTHLTIANSTSDYLNENGDPAIVTSSVLTLNYLTISGSPRGIQLSAGSQISVSNAIITNIFVDSGVYFYDNFGGISGLFMENVSISDTKRESIRKCSANDYCTKQGRQNIRLVNVTVESIYFVQDPVDNEEPYSDFQNTLILATNTIVSHVTVGSSSVVLQDNSEIAILTCTTEAAISYDQTSSCPACSSGLKLK